MKRGKSVTVVALIGFCAVASRVRAQTESEAQSSLESGPDTRTAAQEGVLLTGTLTPRVGAVAALGFGFGGYDGARSSFIGGATAEVRIWGPFALRGGAEYSTTRREMRPTIGARAQVLHQGKHGIDGSFGIFYRPEGFTEPEGEIESFIALGRRFGQLSVLGNLVYGQDPEGNERDGEVRFASLYGVGRWAVGVDSRVRFALTQRSAMAKVEPRFDLFLGPVAVATFGSLAAFAQAGPSVLRQTSGTSNGVAALGGVGAVF